jgi:hypothetical protein
MLTLGRLIFAAITIALVLWGLDAIMSQTFVKLLNGL